MSLIRLEHASLAFGLGRLLDDVTLAIEAGERVAIMGRNGEGKSTLLRVLTGEQTLDDGRVVYEGDLRHATLTQEVPEISRSASESNRDHDKTGAPDSLVCRDASASVWAVIAEGLAGQREMLARYHACARAVESGDAAALDALAEAQADLDAADGWRAAARVDAIVSRFGFDPDARFADLSGGMKRRVWLARALVAEPDLLLLDEPTNHLDLATIGWLERTLPSAARAIVFISHDRAFVDALATRIIELDRGRVFDHPPPVATFIERSRARLENEAKARAEFDRTLAQEEAWIRRGVEARRTRNEGRVRALEQLRVERAERRERLGQARISLSDGERSGKRVLEADGLALGHGQTRVIQPFDLVVQRGDRIGIVGPNGAGKSTLIRGLLGQLPALAGTLRIGTKLEVGYFDQTRAALDPSVSVADTVGDGRDRVTIGDQTRHVLSYLEDFLFPPQRARQPVGVLSGGERARLLLARMLLRPANLLVLDEPTNDLDVETLELLETTLAGFDGTLMIVSHDRAFLDALVTQTLVVSRDGRVSEYVGGFSDLPASVRERLLDDGAAAEDAATERAVNAANATAPAAEARPAPPKARKRSYKEERRLSEVTAAIAELEREQAQLATRLANPAMVNDFQALQAATERTAEIEQELEALLIEWEALESA